MLEGRDITAGYGDVTVLRNVSITCPTGSAVALLGPNGAGKSTLLRILSGLLRPTQGQILLDGEDVTKLRTNQLSRRGLCHVPEGRGIFPSLTLRENLALFSPRGKARVAETLDRATQSFPILGKRMSQTAGSLSGGEQQMLALARGLVSNPKVMLIDELSMGLAPVIVQEILKVVRRIADEKQTAVLLVEQHVQMALNVADRAIVLAHGDVVLTEPANVLLADPLLLRERYLGRTA